MMWSKEVSEKAKYQLVFQEIQEKQRYIETSIDKCNSKSTLSLVASENLHNKSSKKMAKTNDNFLLLHHEEHIQQI